jgi:hypothetical protein
VKKANEEKLKKEEVIKVNLITVAKVRRPREK